MDPRPIDVLTVEELRDEVWYWRTDAAARLFFLMDAVKVTSPRANAGREARRHLAGLIETLSEALRGEYHPACFCCAEPIRPGDAVISDVTEGEMHAECPAPGERSTFRPGGKVFMEPESIVIDEDHPEGGDPALKPDHLVAHEASRLYTHEQIVAKLETARAVLGGAE